MKQLTFFTILSLFSLFVFSCKKDTSAPVTNPSGNSFAIPHTIGSYWIYHWTKVDSLGNETPYPGVDTVTVVGDSVVNGNHYIVYAGTQMGGSQPNWLERDSSGYIVRPGGMIVYSYLNTGIALRTSSDSYYDEVYKMGSPTTVTSTLGTFTVVDLQEILTRSSGSTLPCPTGVNACGDESYTMHTYFASGVGRIRSMASYYAWFINQCSYLRSDLVEYHIAP